MGRHKLTKNAKRATTPEPGLPGRPADAAASFLRTHFSTAIERAAQKELSGVAEFRRLALEVADVGTWEFNLKTNEVLGDDLACAIFGAPKNLLSFEQVIACTHPEDRQRVRQAVQEILQPGSHGRYEMEHRVVWPEGAIHWVSVKGQVFFAAPQVEPTRFVGTVTDISERKAAEEAIKQTRDDLAKISTDLERIVEERTSRLRETVLELEQFSHALVHDMRAPLRAMESYAFLLREEVKETQSQRVMDYLDRIQASSRRLDHLILDALNYSQVSREDLPLEAIELEPLLREMIATYPGLQPPRATVQIHGPLPRVLGNVAGLTQCFSNLLNNAIKFVAPGVQPLVHIQAEPSAIGHRIWVIDNGIGIPREFQSRIFNIFQRLDNRFEGTGIGLAIVRKVMAQMNGRVGVESAPQRGSRFWVELKALP